MRRSSLGLLVFLLVPLSVGSWTQQRQVPPGAITAGNTIRGESNTVEPPMENRSRQINLDQVRQETEELRKLANALPAQMDLVANNQLPKDLSDNLKRIEKLAKHLRGEVTP
jgi:hypothetical protein